MWSCNTASERYPMILKNGPAELRKQLTENKKRHDSELKSWKDIDNRLQKQRKELEVS